MNDDILLIDAQSQQSAMAGIQASRELGTKHLFSEILATAKERRESTVMRILLQLAYAGVMFTVQDGKLTYRGLVSPESQRRLNALRCYRDIIESVMTDLGIESRHRNVEPMQRGPGVGMDAPATMQTRPTMTTAQSQAGEVPAGPGVRVTARRAEICGTVGVRPNDRPTELHT